MIRLQESQIAQILPEYFSKLPEVRALSFALFRAVERLVGYCENIGVFSSVDSAPEPILDMLAPELNTQYYEDCLSVGEKRRLVKNTLSWYTRSGTPQAVEELVRNAFGKGDVKEWFQYGGKPYYFKILTNADMNQESMVQFTNMIARIKNTRSHLESMEFDRELGQQLYGCGICIAEIRTDIGWEE